MAIDKKIKYEMQGGVRNYLGTQKTVSDVPLKWKSGPDKPATELAYITKAEKDLLLKKDIHGSLKNGPNKGPAGIMSLDSAGDKDGPVGGYSGADVSAAETGKAVKGMSARDLAGFRAGAISAGARAGLNETQAVKDRVKALQKQYGPRVGTSKFGFLSPKNIFTGLLGLINPALGFLSKGLANIDLQGLRGYNPDGTPMSQDDYEKARKDRQLTNRLDNLYDRKLSGKNFSQKNIDMLESMGVTTSKGNIKSAIDRDIAMNPEMPQFATSYIQSLAQPDLNRFSNTVAPMGVNVPKGILNTMAIDRFEPSYDTLGIPDFSDINMAAGMQINPKNFTSSNLGLPSNNLVAEITQKDIDRFKQPMTQMMDYDTYKSINPDSTVTPDEFNQLKAQV